MATEFLVELVLSGHDVFLLEDEETDGSGVGTSAGASSGRGTGFGGGWGDGYRNGGCGQGKGGGRVLPWNVGDDGGGDGGEKKDEYGYRIPE